MTRTRIGLAICSAVLLSIGTLHAHDVEHTSGVVAQREFFPATLGRRAVLILRPATSPDSALPTLILLPYLNGRAEDMAALTHAADLVRDDGALVVIPEAVNGRWNIGTTLTAAKLNDDVTFLSGLIDRLVADQGADPRRIYMAGYSNGGYMAERFACEQPGRIAAFGMVAATFYKTVERRCHPAQPVPMMLINGTQDTDEAGNATLDSAAGTATFWAARNHCPNAPIASTLPDTVDDGTHVDLQAYSACPGGDVLDYVVVGGGHTWPGALDFTPALGPTTQDVDATQLLWQFFRQQAR